MLLNGLQDVPLTDFLKALKILLMNFNGLVMLALRLSQQLLCLLGRHLRVLLDLVDLLVYPGLLVTVLVRLFNKELSCVVLNSILTLLCEELH